MSIPMSSSDAKYDKIREKLTYTEEVPLDRSDNPDTEHVEKSDFSTILAALNWCLESRVSTFPVVQLHHRIPGRRAVWHSVFCRDSTSLVRGVDVHLIHKQQRGSVCGRARRRSCCCSGVGMTWDKPICPRCGLPGLVIDGDGQCFDCNMADQRLKPRICGHCDHREQPGEDRRAWGRRRKRGFGYQTLCPHCALKAERWGSQIEEIPI